MGLLRDLLPPVVSPKMLSWVLHYGFWAMSACWCAAVLSASPPPRAGRIEEMVEEFMEAKGNNDGATQAQVLNRFLPFRARWPTRALLCRVDARAPALPLSPSSDAHGPRRGRMAYRFQEEERRFRASQPDLFSRDREGFPASAPLPGRGAAGAAGARRGGGRLSAGGSGTDLGHV